MVVLGHHLESRVLRDLEEPEPTGQKQKGREHHRLDSADANDESAFVFGYCHFRYRLSAIGFRRAQLSEIGIGTTSAAES
jgi:hypothetical protein